MSGAWSPRLVAAQPEERHRRYLVNLLRNSKVGMISCALALSVGIAASSASARVTAHAAGVNANSFTNTFSALHSLKGLAAAGKGKIAAILPDTTSSTRYVEFDAPDIKK